jgi:hypothetical protein
MAHLVVPQGTFTVFIVAQAAQAAQTIRTVDREPVGDPFHDQLVTYGFDQPMFLIGKIDREI